MKKYLLSIGLIIVVSVSSCRKEEITKLNSKNNSPTPDISTTSQNHGREAPTGISVSERGYLVFESLEQVTDFTDFLNNSNHAEIQEYINSINRIINLSRIG